MEARSSEAAAVVDRLRGSGGKHVTASRGSHCAERDCAESSGTRRGCARTNQKTAEVEPLAASRFVAQTARPELEAS